MIDEISVASPLVPFHGDILLVSTPFISEGSLLNADLPVKDSQLVLRPSEAGDEGFLYRVYASTRSDEMALLDWTAEQKTAFLNMQFNAQRGHYRTHFPNAEYQIIQRQGLPIGRLIVDRSKDPLLLMDITLLPEYRNAGIGRIIIHDLLAEAAGRNWSVCLHVEAFNPAMRLYERLGFVKTAEQGIYHELRWQPEAE